VTRVVQFGSEPLFDDVLPHGQLTEQVRSAKAKLSPLGIQSLYQSWLMGKIPHPRSTYRYTLYRYQERGGAQDVLDAIDSINIHMLPFFSSQASIGSLLYFRPADVYAIATANKSWPLVLNDLQFFIRNGNGKKMYLDESVSRNKLTT